VVAPSRMSYRDAVILLSAEDAQLVEKVDKALGGAILAASIVMGPGALAFLEAKNAAIELSRQLLSRFGVHIRGITIPARADRIRAASAVITVIAFMTAARDLIGKDQWRNLQLGPSEIIPAADRTHTKSSFISSLVSTGLPAPEPHQSIDELENNLREFYNRVSDRLIQLIKAMALWDRLSETERDRLTVTIKSQLPDLAIQEYRAGLLSLAIDVPELAIWINLQEHAVTRAAVGDFDTAIIEMIRVSQDVRTALKGTNAILQTVTSGLQTNVTRWRRSLIDANTYELRRPLLDMQHEVVKVVAPILLEGYINPNFRVVEATREARPSAERWWNNYPSRDDLQQFLASYLTSSVAVRAPLLVLGHPGAGKSILTKVLAAQLPSEGFAPIRVSLRDVAANSSIIAQIEQAFYNTIHERISWPEFVEHLDGALPVVLLDGFDELLQATGVSQSVSQTTWRRLVNFKRQKRVKVAQLWYSSRAGPR
jgi:hypothetical protein